MLTRIEEIALLARCVVGDDRRAFGRLVEAYQPGVRRMLLNLTRGDTSLTDDLAQETFLKAYLNVQNFKGLSSFSTWLYRIAYNEFVGHTRHQHEQAMEASTLATLSTGSEQLDTDALAVRQAIATLGEVERVVVTLFYLEDLPIKQISQIMQLPQGTIKSHLHRARAHLAVALGEKTLTN